MRIAFIGAGRLSVMTAQSLIGYGHEVIIMERDKQKIDELSDTMDCGFLQGDGSRPAVLKEVGPEHTDYLFCLTENDQVNIIASLLGRSLGFSNVVTKIEDTELEHICTELGLDHTIIPTRTISRFLTDMVGGQDILELSIMIKGDARVFSFVTREEDEGEVAGLQLPETARVICYYREGKFNLADEKSKLKKGDEVVVLTHRENLDKLKERWVQPANSKESAV
jgi:trk system potassium uptake protein TrkA